jgi:hypothetical protein
MEITMADCNAKYFHPLLCAAGFQQEAAFRPGIQWMNRA